MLTLLPEGAGITVTLGVPCATGAEVDCVVAAVPAAVAAVPAAVAAVPLTVGEPWEVETAVPDDGVPVTAASVVGTAVGEGCGVGVSIGGRGVSVWGTWVAVGDAGSTVTARLWFVAVGSIWVGAGAGEQPA